MKLGHLLSGAGVGLAAASCTGRGSDSPFPMPLCNGVDIEDATINTLQQWMILGKLTSQDLVQCYLARIEQTNG